MAKRQAQKQKGSSAIKQDFADPVKPEVSSMPPLRRQLLAQLAGNVAAGIFASSSEPPATAAGVAEVAVDVAEEILQKVGL